MTLRWRTLTRTARFVRDGLASLAGLTVLIAGCSSSPSSPGTSAPGTSTPGASSGAPGASSGTSVAPASSGPSAAPSASPASSGAAAPRAGTGGPPACPTRSLKATAGSSQGAAGSIYQVIDFTNISSAPCTLYGYPGVSLAGGSPVAQIGAAASRSATNPVKLVTLAAGGTASALLRITEAGNYPASECDPVPSGYLQIYPPNQTTPIYLAYKSTACSATAVNLLSVSAVQPGSGG
jgi:hypothetical protein